MDYRKPVTFGDNWSSSRYRVLPYFKPEKALLSQPEVERIVDVGCAAGWNMSRFVQYGRRPMGLDLVPDRVRLARRHGPTMVASGLNLPVASGSQDVVYIQHVLHHLGEVRTALAEAARVLRAGGFLFLVETVEDSPFIRWGRRLHPSWLGDEVTATFRFDELREMVEAAGLRVTDAKQYSVLFWLWEVFPDRWPALERLTPLFVAGEQFLARFWRPHSAHCYLVARKARERKDD